MEPRLYKLVLTGLILLFSIDLFAEEATVEWAPFVKASDITEQRLVAAADSVNANFLILQKGFIKRELVKKSDNEYADIIHWRTRADAISAGEKVMDCDKCNEYFKLMDMEASAGEGFAHYDIIKSWKR